MKTNVLQWRSFSKIALVTALLLSSMPSFNVSASSSVSFTGESNAGFPNIPYAGRVIVGDFDSDGDYDILYQTGATGTAIRYARSNGDGTFTDMDQSGSPFSGVTISDLLTANTSVADFDGDGFEDVWIRSNSSIGIYFKNNGNGTYSNVPSPGFPTIPLAGRVVVGDFDMDGDTDVLYQTGAAGTAIKYARSNGDGTFTEMDQSSSPFSGVTINDLLTANTSVADFDGDGFEDVWIRSNSSIGIYFKNNGNGTYSNVPSPGFPTIPLAGRVVVGDFDTDGDADVLYQVGASGTAIRYARSNGDGTFTDMDQSSSPFSGIAITDLLTSNTSVADFDGDTDQDLWIRSNTSKGIYVRQNISPPFLVATTPANHAMNVSPTANIALTFTESVTKGTGNISIINSSTNTVIEQIDVSSSQVTGSGANWTIAPSVAFVSGQSYAVYTNKGVFKDSDGMIFAGIQKNKSLKFTINAAASDTTSPELSGIGSSNVSLTTATLSAASNETGTMYYVLTTSPTAPSAAQVMAGQDYAGAATFKSGSMAVTANNAVDIPVTQLHAGTPYYAYFVVMDGSHNTSGVSSTSFTTITDNSPWLYYLTSDGSSATNGTEDAIKRFKPDGSNEFTIATAIAKMPSDLTVDLAGGKAYFLAGDATTSGEQAVKAVDLTTGAVTTVTPLSQTPAFAGIQYDPSSGYIYYLTSDGNSATNSSEDALWKVKPDGSNQAKIAGSVSKIPGDLTLDIAGGKAYFMSGDTTVNGDRAIKAVDLTTGAVSNVKTLSQTPAHSGIQYDPSSGYIYYLTSDGNGNTNTSDDAFWRIKPDGSEDFKIASSVSKIPGDLALDLIAGKAYFFSDETGTGDKTIKSVDLTTYAVSTVKALNQQSAFAGIVMVGNRALQFDPVWSSPSNNESHVDPNANLTLAFNQKVLKGVPGHFTIQDVTAGTTIETVANDDAHITGWGTNTLTIDPINPLPGGHSISVQWDNGIVQDYYNSFIQANASDTTYAFTTSGTAQNPAPTVSVYEPADDGTGVDVNTNLVLTFTKSVSAVAGKNIVIRSAFDNSAVETIAATDTTRVTVSGATVTVNPSAALLYSSDYYVQIDAGAFKDSNNADYAGIADQTTWRFQTEIRSEVTAANSAALNQYMANGHVDTINLVNGTTYQYDGGTITRDLTVNGNGATIQAGAGVDDTIVRSDDITVDSAALPNYTGKSFLRVGGTGSKLTLNNTILENGTNPIFTVINIKTGGSLSLDGVTIKGFHNNATPGNNLSFGIHAEPGAVSTTIENSVFASSNAFRNAVAIRNGGIQISGSTFEGTDYPERLRQSDGYEYAIYIYGGSGTITQNMISGYDSTTQQGYASALGYR